MENEVITSSGMRLLIAWRNTLLRDAEGLIIGTLSAGMDITDRKRAEEAMRETVTLAPTESSAYDEDLKKIGSI